MDQTTLVTRDNEIEGKVVSALSRARIPVTAVNWNWEDEKEQWQLIIVTPWVDTRGPRETYARIFGALSLAGVPASVRVREIFVKSPRDPVAKKLIEELKRTTEGSVHITRDVSKQDASKNGAAKSKYSLVFAPYFGRGGAIPSKRLDGEPELRVFLEKSLGVISYIVDQALAELAQRHQATIFNVPMNLRRAKRLKLAA